jgi:long-chain fatty acid transport protein
MAKRFTFKRLFILMSSAGVLSFSQYAMASAFQLNEQDGASVGNYHAGRAASAEDASTAFYNPAGLTKIHNQQLVISADPVLTNVIFRGTVDVNTEVSTGNFVSGGPVPATAQGGGFNLIPAFHYAAPITDKLVIALSAFSPFGLKTDYGRVEYTRYAATLTSLKVVDFSPSFGYAITDKFSVGAGLDIQRANAQFSLVAGNPPIFGSTAYDTDAQNTGSDHAYGYHLGVLYDYSPATRIGLAYQSKVVHMLKGTSLFTGPFANLDNPDLGQSQSSNYLNTKIVLPPTTTLSLFHTFNPTWDVMGTVMYTQWNVIQAIVLNNVSGMVASPSGPANSNNITVTIPENYRNTWNVSAGVNYHVNDHWMLRSGVGYDQSPANNTDKNLQLPDNSRIAAAVGAHFQATKALGFDLGWTHLFVLNTRVNNSLTVGAQTSTVVGSVQSSADVYGMQMKWDIA